MWGKKYLHNNKNKLGLILCSNILCFVSSRLCAIWWFNHPDWPMPDDPDRTLSDGRIASNVLGPILPTVTHLMVQSLRFIKKKVIRKFFYNIHHCVKQEANIKIRCWFSHKKMNLIGNYFYWQEMLTDI
jgi:hypothetical protein